MQFWVLYGLQPYPIASMTLKEQIIEKLPKKKEVEETGFSEHELEKVRAYESVYNQAIDDVHSSIDDIIGVVREAILALPNVEVSSIHTARQVDIELEAKFTKSIKELLK